MKHFVKTKSLHKQDPVKQTRCGHLHGALQFPQDLQNRRKQVFLPNYGD